MCMKIYPSVLKGSIQVPPSKSYMQRALIGGLLSEGITEIFNPGRSEDDRNMLQNIEKLGAKVEDKEGEMIIKGGLQLKDNKLHVGESGLGVRLITPVVSLFDEEVIITGGGSLMQRPMHVMEKALNNLGASCESQQGYLPLKVKGPLKGGEIAIDGSLSSQFLSGLLFTLPRAPNTSTIYVNNLKSKPYIDMTLNILEAHGINITHDHYKKFTIPGNQAYQPARHFLEGDWSNGAFLLVAGAINGIIKVKGLNSKSSQGDKKILQALHDSGAKIKQNLSDYEVEKTSALRAFHFDATETPDLFPPLACLAAYCEGTSHIKGVSRLKHKESNRAEALVREFSNAGVKIELKNDDSMQITGGNPKGGRWNSHNDHRIAMAGAVLGLKTKMPVTIEGYAAVNKSYPSFFKDLTKLNANIEKENKNGN
ncbi:MAG: 3-phosphoshikimate 1-carboxyvinyltransferase [Bacteroidales bacterium]